MLLLTPTHTPNFTQAKKSVQTSKQLQNTSDLSNLQSEEKIENFTTQTNPEETINNNNSQTEPEKKIGETLPRSESEETAKTPSSPATETFLVTKVVDGDTIDVAMNGGTERIRLIGINTPEMNRGGTPACLAVEATEQTTGMLLGKRVRLESDPTQADRDKYTRLLRFVFMEDGVNYNEWIIRQG